MSLKTERIAVALLVLTVLLCRARALQAQACCGANSTTDFGVVGPDARATAASTLGYQQGFGSFDAAGQFDGDGKLRDRDLLLRIGGGVRLWPKQLQLHGGVPLRMQHRDLGQHAATDVGIGDVTAVLRFTALKPEVDGIDFDEPESFVPLLDVYVGLKAPIGAPPGADRDSTQADVFGSGAWELTLGTKITKSLTVRHLLALRVQYDVRFATERDLGTAGQVEFEPGNQLGFRLEWLYAPTMYWSAGLFGDLRTVSKAAQDGVTVPDSQERLFAVGGQVTYAFAFPEWDVTFGLNSDSFWNQGGVNIPFASFGASVGLRRTFLDAGEDSHQHDHHHHHMHE